MTVQLVSKMSNLCGPDPRASQTDGQADIQTDGRHAMARSRYAVCAIVHRAVITAAFPQTCNVTCLSTLSWMGR